MTDIAVANGNLQVQVSKEARKAIIEKIGLSIEDCVSSFIYCSLKYLNNLGDCETELHIYSDKINEVLFTQPTEEGIYKILHTLTIDLSFLRILGHLNDYNLKMIEMIYKATKFLIKFAVNGGIDHNIQIKSTEGQKCDSNSNARGSKNVSPSISISSSELFTVKIQHFVSDTVKKIIEELMKSLRQVKNEIAITFAGKLVRLIIQTREYFKKILTVTWINELFSFTRSANFILASEASKIISVCIADSPCAEVFEEFLMNTKTEFNSLIHQTMSADSTNEKGCYFSKRETMKYLLQILNSNHFFADFSNYYLSKKENLKIIMNLLNHTSGKLRDKAINILYLFFLNVEQRDTQVKVLLLNNKRNFEKYFDLLDENFSDAAITEKKNYILYGLERLQNHLY